MPALCHLEKGTIMPAIMLALPAHAYTQLLLPEEAPSVLTVLDTTEAERNTEQNNKDNQGLFAATSCFMLSQSSGNYFYNFVFD